MSNDLDLVEVFGVGELKEIDYHCWQPYEDYKMEGSPFPESDISVSTPSHFSEQQQDLGAQDVTTLELEILSHPNLDAHLSTVCLYIKMDLVLLESISYLRQEGLWNSSMQQLYSNSVQRPKVEHLAELAGLHPSLFQSPPPSLFNLVCEYRKTLDSNSTDIVERFLQLLRPSSLERDRKSLGAGRKTAPQGRVYACPSAHCRKIFKKVGHARNHVKTRHAEYLHLNPEYHPESHMVMVDRTQMPD